MQVLRDACLSILVLVGAHSQDPRGPLPSEPEQVQAERMIRELYQADFSKKTPYSMKLFATRLLEQAKETRDDRALRYVLYREAADLAAQIGNPSIALGSLHGMAKEFRFDLTAARHALLVKLHPNVSKPDDYRELCEGYFRSVDEYRASDQFGDAARALTGARSAAERGNDPSLLKHVEETERRLSELAKNFEKAEQARKILSASPGDPDASRAVGEYLCLDKTQWKEGLPFLAKATDAGLAGLATRDVSQPSVPKDQVAVADDWWTRAEKEDRSGWKSSLFGRARFWYERARNGLDGAVRERIAARLHDLDLREEPSLAALVGRWSFEEGEQDRVLDSSGKGNHGTLENGARRIEGYSGKGVSFDGKASFIALGARGMPAAEAPQTVLWAHQLHTIPRRPESIVVLSDVPTQTNLTAGLREDKVVVWKWGGIPLVAALSPPLEEWHFFAYTFDGTIHRLYVDGFLKDESAIPCQKGSYSKLEIGRWLGHDARGPGSFFKGSVDEVRVYDRALGEDEIRNITRRR